MSGREAGHVAQAFASNYIAPLGPQVDAFEAAFAEHTGIAHCLAVSSGTAAIHLALRCLGVDGGDEMLAGLAKFGEEPGAGGVIAHAQGHAVVRGLGQGGQRTQHVQTHDARAAQGRIVVEKADDFHLAALGPHLEQDVRDHLPVSACAQDHDLHRHPPASF